MLGNRHVDLLMCWGAPAAVAVNYSYPAMYTGSTAVGGKAEFDTSSDGSSVIRFAAPDVPNPCGIGRPRDPFR